MRWQGGCSGLAENVLEVMVAGRNLGNVRKFRTECSLSIRNVIGRQTVLMIVTGLKFELA